MLRRMRDFMNDQDNLVTSWFKDHIVEGNEIYQFCPGRVIEMLTWRKPGTSIYRIDYTRRSNILMITGDVGDAIYTWGEVHDLRWISTCDLQYFASKCQASEVGRRYEDWDRDSAKKWLEKYFSDGDDEEDRKRLAKERQKAEDLYIWEALFNKMEWTSWMMQNGHDVFGPDLCGFEHVGIEIALRCRAHLIGLKMAFAFIDKKEVKYG